jgi:hypothetical protein
LSRRIISLAVSVAALLVAYGCGSGSSDTSVRTGTQGAGTSVRAADGAVDAAGLRTVSYRGVEFDVPADWPVYDLSADPTTCVRFDVHAVYLGRPSADMQCPAGLVGRAEAVLVEPASGANGQRPGSTAGVSTESVNGLSAEVVSGGDVTYQLDATFPSSGIAATITYQDGDATAQQILGSFRPASSAPASSGPGSAGTVAP